MEHIPSANARKFESDAVTSWEYDMRQANLNVAPISIVGRYPTEGYTRNTLSDAIVHVTDGIGVVGLQDGTLVELNKNDQIHLAVGDVYYFEGDLDVIYAATPGWTPEQTEHIDA